MDTLSNLKAFIAVADAGSFSEVARRQQVAPSVITKRIAQLEWRIKAPLFLRSTRRLSLTDVGERYLPQVRALLTGTARDLGAPGRDAETGAGLINIRAALARMTQAR